MQEKVSTIIPPKSTDNVTQSDLIENNTSLRDPIIGKIINSNQSTSSTDSELDNLARLVSANMDMTLKGEKQPTTSATNVSVKTQVISKVINTTQNKSLVDNTLDSLALSVLNNIDIELKGDKHHTTKALEVGDNWEVITKKDKIIKRSKKNKIIKTAKEDKIIETAKAFLGVKYVWAANGPNSFDCSGFTKYVFEKHGITIPRYSGYQAHVGKKIAYNKLKKGDLVFFGTDKIGKVNHVGIYLGHHKFIHASSGGKKVMITSFVKKKFYKNRFLHGQRIVHSHKTLASL